MWLGRRAGSSAIAASSPILLPPTRSACIAMLPTKARPSPSHAATPLSGHRESSATEVISRVARKGTAAGDRRMAVSVSRPYLVREFPERARESSVEGEAVARACRAR